ncbi:hypothetical protein SAMN03159453_05159 [Pseudomonas sp. NFIX28]|nr:hypothetical protein SAMN03159453_05159 [Pseudomonas sp. NFIX28]
MIYYLSRYLTDPPYTVSEQLTSHLHPPSSCALVVKGSQQLR